MEMPQSAASGFVDEVLTPDEVRPASIDEVEKLPSFLSKLRKLEQQEKKRFDQMEHETQNAVVLRRLQQMVNTVRLNPLWRERLDMAGVKKAPQTFEEWQQIPIADKSTMKDFFMGSRPGMVVPLNRGGFEIVASGGTGGGAPLESVYPISELHDTYQLAGEFMWNHILRHYMPGTEPKWVITTLADYQMWSSGTMVGGVLQNIPNINYIGAGPIRQEVFEHMFSYPGPKAFLGISQGVALLTELGASLGVEERNRFHVAFYGSGLLPHRKHLELKALYPNISILSYFAATQAETIGLQLTPLTSLVGVPGLHLVEIVDEDGRWVDVGEEGELVVTRLHGHGAPFPRLKIGDRMIRRDNLEIPELKTQQFDFVGRSGAMIHLGDSQYSASKVYEHLCEELRGSLALDLPTTAHEVQFTNFRNIHALHLVAVVDDPVGLNGNVAQTLGPDGVAQLFVGALIRSMSLFNAGEANAESIDKTGYRFELEFVDRQSPKIFRTEVGKVPLIRDDF